MNMSQEVPWRSCHCNKLKLPFSASSLKGRSAILHRKKNTHPSKWIGPFCAKTSGYKQRPPDIGIDGLVKLPFIVSTCETSISFWIALFNIYMGHLCNDEAPKFACLQARPLWDPWQMDIPCRPMVLYFLRIGYNLFPKGISRSTASWPRS